MTCIKPFRFFLLLFLCLTLISGCQFFKKDEISEEETDSHESYEEDLELDDEESLFKDPRKPQTLNYRPISVVSDDGFKLEGTLYVPNLEPYDPEAEEEDEDDYEEEEEIHRPEVKTKYPLIILMHMLSDDRWVWRKIPKKLVKENYAVLAIDLRGHGDSVYIGKRLKVWRQFDSTDWKKMPKDLNLFLDAINKDRRFPMVDTEHIGIIGASIGANAAINFAAYDPAKRVEAIVALSPGLEYHGLETFEPLSHYEKALFLIASKEDSYAAESTERLYRFILGKKKLIIYKEMGHGTDMLVNDPPAIDKIIDWLKDMLSPPGYTAKARKPIKKSPKKDVEEEQEGKGPDAEEHETDKHDSETSDTHKPTVSPEKKSEETLESGDTEDPKEHKKDLQKPANNDQKTEVAPTKQPLAKPPEQKPIINPLAQPPKQANHQPVETEEKPSDQTHNEPSSESH